jgi:AGCS family alanine or glycine:cation symporter
MSWTDIQTHLDTFFTALGDIVWGWPMLILLVGSGVFLTVVLGGIQFRTLGYALKLAFGKEARSKNPNAGQGDITNFEALMTALAATAGVGNIVGVATAVALGGPGAVFWMWMSGLFGMATKYTECLLGVYYRRRNAYGEMSGGPMYYIRDGLADIRWMKALRLNVLLGGAFAVMMALGATVMGGMVQSNAVSDTMHSTFGVPLMGTAVVITALAALVMLGGVQRLGTVSSALVPTMVVIYALAGTAILLLNAPELPALFASIFTDAFSGTAAVGGFAGAALKEAIRYGLARGTFANESGMGSAPIAAAAARTKHPVEQGLISMTQTFLDTFLICTFSALVVLVADVWLTGKTGGALTAESFGQGLPWQIANVSIGAIVVTVSLTLFAYTTIIGWSFYGEKGLAYLGGDKLVKPYRVFYLMLVFIGANMSLPLAWKIVENFTGLMIVPNLIACVLLFPLVKRLTADYFANLKNGKLIDKPRWTVKPFAHD